MRVWPLAAWLLVACRAAPAPFVVPPVPVPSSPPPLVPPSAPPVAPPAPPALAPALAPSPAVVASSPAAAPPPAPVLLLLEPPYSALGHARLATEMQTLGRDDELFRWALGGSSEPAHPSNQPGYHPATRVVVDVQLLSRAPKGTTKRLQRIARSSGYWPLRACFENAQRISEKAERTARVRLTLSAAGKVLGARSVAPAPEREYARCVLERARGLDYTPGFGRKLDLEISVKQWPGHAPVPPRAPDDSAPLRLPAEVRAALEGLSPALGACYEAALQEDPKLWGRIALRLELDTDGMVLDARPVETRFPRPEVTECARRAVIGAHLPGATVKQLSFAIRLGQPPAPPPPTAGSPPLEVEGSPPAPPSLPPVPPAPVH